MGVEFSLTYLSGVGSLLGFTFFGQSLTGVMLSFYFTPTSEEAFNSLQYIMYEAPFGWLFRVLHFNGASFFFILLYLHLYKALLLFSYRLKEVWVVGLLILVVIMGEAFLGYSLAWSQMSFWAATVITSLLSVLPLYGFSLVIWVWGGFSLNSNSLKFFFIIHFLLPFFIGVLVGFHLHFLHFYGSTSKLGLSSKITKRSFYPFYWYKDLVNLVFLMLGVLYSLHSPFNLGESLGFEELNELVSPVHIVPEWYFLWAYAILRAVPSKLLGVAALLGGILVFFLFLLGKTSMPKPMIWKKFFLMFFFVNAFFLSWLGGAEPLPPFVTLSGVSSGLFFFLVLSMLSLNFLN